MIPASRSVPVSCFLCRTRAAVARRGGPVLPILLGLATAAGAPSAAPGAWQDPATGLAIGGYDPLAYFTQGKPRTGREGVELSWGGAVWLFLNIGNKAAFEHAPYVYAPRFAGYDAYALSQGVTTRGQPLIWARHEDRIYLFHNGANLRLWQQNREEVTARAEKHWPTLSENLPASLAE